VSVSLEGPIRRFNRDILGYGAGLVLPLLALGLSYYVPIFSRIPWTSSFFAVAIVAWVGGVGPALLAILIASCATYGLILAPATNHLYAPIALVQTVAFDLTALLIVYLVRQQNLATSSLQASEMHYRSVTETASDVVVTIDGRSRILSINPAVKAMFGYDPEELIGEQLLTLMPEKFRMAHVVGIAKHLATGARHIPWTGVQLSGRHKNGEEIPIEISFGSYTSQGQKRFTGFIRDISDRRRAQAALMQSEKLAAVGRLASSIAHEINNPLEAITNLIYLSQGSTDLEEVQTYLETAEREIGRISVIANQTLQFHKQSSLPEAVSCEELIGGAISLYQGRLINGDVTVERRQRARRPAICVEGEIRQVLNNLIGNAIDALPPRAGRILIRSRDATDWKRGKAGVVLTVADTGTGMSPHTRAKIFEPFFTTKGAGGAGLGLWICCQLTEQNQGMLRVRSSQLNGRSGTVFTLFLPYQVLR
jgi:PAS domain S-box-containing protein